MYDEKPAYLISFDMRAGLKDVGFKGQFYIDKEDFAFLELDYGLSPESVQYHKFGNILNRAFLEILGVDVKVLGNQSRIRYRQVGEKYYLKDVQGTQDMHFKSDRSFYNFVLKLKIDYLVTDLKFEEVEEFAKEDVVIRNNLIEHQDILYDSLFWQNHTVLVPEEDFSEIARIINENNKANDTKKEIGNQLKKFPKNSQTRIDSIITFYHKKGLFHGNVLVASEGAPILSKSYPYKDQELDLSSRFRIGSTSKTFTSMLILMLEKEGRLSLSDSIGKYIPDYIHGEVTIAQLLSHQSGIPNYTIDENFTDIFKTSYNVDVLVNRFCSEELEFSPGSSFEYSNSGYVLLAKIAEVVGEKPFDELLSENIFQPLGMYDTSFGIQSKDNLPVDSYYYDQPEPDISISNLIGAGGIISTVSDLLTWSNTLENGVFDPILVAKAMTPQVDYTDWKAQYGYGWMIDEYMFNTSKKHKLVYHPGTSMGFYSMFLKQPDEGISIILLSNTGDFPRFEMTDLILRVLN